jgi:8-hydroxy-5-deazaflavin:NADPH oxidoreductase
MKTNVVLKRGRRRFLQTAGERPGIPLAADDPAALQVAVRRVQDAGFEPVVVGGLARAKDFDAGTPIFGKPMSAAEVRRTLGIGS